MQPVSLQNRVVFVRKSKRPDEEDQMFFRFVNESGAETKELLPIFTVAQLNDALRIFEVTDVEPFTKEDFIDRPERVGAIYKEITDQDVENAKRKTSLQNKRTRVTPPPPPFSKP